MQRVLIIETAFLGDAIIATALAEAIKALFPEAEIDMLVRPEAASVVSFAPSVSGVKIYDKYGVEAGKNGIDLKADELNAIGYDTTFCLHRSRRTAMLLQALNVKHKVGFSYSDFVTSTLTIAVEASNVVWKVSQIQQLLKPFAELDRLHLPTLRFPLTLIPDPVSQFSDYVTIAPGSVWRTKQWGVEKYVDLVQKLISDDKKIVLIGSPADRNTSDAILHCVNADNAVIDMVGHTSVEQAGAIISRARRLIGNDSAPIHLALAVGTQSTILLGPTVRAFGFIPPHEYADVIEADSLWCRPCSSHGSDECPIHTHECMKLLLAEDVISSLYTKRN